MPAFYRGSPLPEGEAALDVEMDNFAILDSSGLIRVYNLLEDEEEPEIVREKPVYLASTGAATCVVIYADSHDGLKAVAHVSALCALSEAMELMQEKMIILSGKRPQELQIRFFLYGGTVNSVAEFLSMEDDGAFTAPAFCSLNKNYLAVNKESLNEKDDQDHVSIFTDGKQLILQQVIAQKEINTIIDVASDKKPARNNFFTEKSSAKKRAANDEDFDPKSSPKMRKTS